MSGFLGGINISTVLKPLPLKSQETRRSWQQSRLTPENCVKIISLPQTMTSRGHPKQYVVLTANSSRPFSQVAHFARNDLLSFLFS
jgi:hypothetical protein